jgi:hypothetical protein
MIIRNTEWSKQFLHNWWNAVDKSLYCDQDAFDVLYHSLLKKESTPVGIVEKIQILSTDSLNSHPPAWKYFPKPDNVRVLHLMGESSLYRAHIFRNAFKNLCLARSGGKLLNGLGLSRQYLQDIARFLFVCSFL